MTAYSVEGPLAYVLIVFMLLGAIAVLCILALAAYDVLDGWRPHLRRRRATTPEPPIGPCAPTMIFSSEAALRASEGVGHRGAIAWTVDTNEAYIHDGTRWKRVADSKRRTR